MTRNFTKQNSLAKPTYPFFTFFCIGLASSCLAASLLLAPCGVTDARAWSLDDLNLVDEDIQVNPEWSTIDEVIRVEDNIGSTDYTYYIGMGVVSHELHHRTSITNKGTIILIDPEYNSETLFNISGMYASHKTGIPCSTRDLIEAINEGNITIKVTSAYSPTVIGITATDHHANSIVRISNSGSINLEGPSIAKGIYSHIDDYLGSIVINNTGDISVKGNGSETSGIYTALAHKSTDPDTQAYISDINNSGTITVENKDYTSYAIHSVTKTYDRAHITNSGTIKATSANENTKAIYIAHQASLGTITHLIHNTGYIEAKAQNQAYGIFTNPYGSSQAFPVKTINDGTISATSIDQEATGIYHFQITYSGISNTGTINATSENNAAYGIKLIQSNNTVVSNTGTVNAKGATASHELFVEGGNATIGTWAVTLRDYKDADNSSDPFAVKSMGKIIFSDQKIPNYTVPGVHLQPTTFIVTAGTTEDGFAFNKEFPIQDMIYNYGGGIITGAVGIVESAVPFLKAELLHDVVNGADYENAATNTTDTEQTIIIRTNVDTGTSPGHEAEEQIVTGLTQNMNMLCSILDTQLDYDEMPENWRAFAVPYYTHGVNYDYGYNTDVMGIALGATHRVNDNFSAGMHLNFATIDSESDATKNDALMAGLGVHAKYHVTDAFHIRGQVTGFVMENRLGLSMNAKPEKVMAKVDTTSLGMYAAMFAAYDYKANEHHTFTPEVALKYVYAQHDGYDTDWHTAAGAPVDLDISYGDTSFDALYAEASLRWKGNYDLGIMESGKHRGVLHPTMRAGVRQALMGAEVESNLRYNEFDFGTTTSHANQTSVLFEGGLEWVYGDTTTSLSYIADFGNTEESHMGMLKIEFEF